MIRKFLLVALVALTVGVCFAAAPVRAAEPAEPAAAAQTAGSVRSYHYRYRQANSTVWNYGRMNGNSNQWSALVASLQRQGYSVSLISAS